MATNQATPEHHHFHGLDHLRTLAIVLVFMFHYQLVIFGHPDWISTYAKFGWTGVDLFFVLSGFLISSQLFASIRANGKLRYKDFFLKRFFRIIPAFWTLIAIYFCIPLFHEKEALPPLWKFLSFTQNFGLNLATNGTFSHAWSLCVEEHFYVALPLTLIVLTRIRSMRAGVILLAILFACGFVFRQYSWAHLYQSYLNEEGAGIRWYQYVYYPTYNRLDGLLVGVSIATMYVFAPATWRRISAYGNVWFVVSLLLLTAAYFVCEDQWSWSASIFGFPLVAIGYGAMVMAAISETSFLYKWKSRTTALIATLSYGLYLSHKGVIHMTQQVAGSMGMDVSGNIVLLLCIAACVLFAGVLYVAVERPFMRLRSMMVERKRESAIVP